jgi:hypothetical protein
MSEEKKNGWQMADPRTGSPFAIAKDVEDLKDRLREVVAPLPIRFEEAWTEFTRRCKSSQIKPPVQMDDLIWDIQAGRWPKNRKKPSAKV